MMKGSINQARRAEGSGAVRVAVHVRSACNDKLAMTRGWRGSETGQIDWMMRKGGIRRGNGWRLAAGKQG